MLGSEHRHVYEHGRMMTGVKSGFALAQNACVVPRAMQKRNAKLAGARRLSRRAPVVTYQPAYKPGSVWPAGVKPANVTAIPLARRLPGASSNLPE